MSSSAATPSTIATVLVATDFSDTAAVALRRGEELARRFGARLVLCHSVLLEPIPLGSAELNVLPADFQRRVEQASREELEALVAESAARSGVECEGVLEVGAPATTLLAAARDKGADLIVMGTRGLSGFRHLVLGSTAEQVVRSAEAPVLTVHPGDARSLDAIGSVLVPTDFSEDAERAIRFAKLFLAGDQANARLVLLHVVQLPAALQPLGARYTASAVMITEARKQVEAQLEARARALRDAGFQVETRIDEGDPPTCIEKIAQQEDVDLIAMGTHGHSGVKHLVLGSTAERVVQHAGRPVLSLRIARKV